MRICAHMKLHKAIEAWAADYQRRWPSHATPKMVADYKTKFKDDPSFWINNLLEYGIKHSDLDALAAEKRQVEQMRRLR